MRRTVAFRGALTLLGITAIALVAAILDSPIDFSSDGGGGMQTGGTGAVEPLTVPEIPLVVQVLVLVVGIVLAGLCVLWLVENPMEYLTVVAGICLGVALILAMIVALMPFVSEEPVQQAADSGSPSPDAADVTDEPGGNVNATAYFIALFGGWFLVFMLFVLYLRSRASPSTETDADRPDLDDGTPAAVGAAAGRAATQIENASAGDLENEIYRAWNEMTGLLPVESPETTTPREFESAAVEAGLERSDVAALTDLFEGVRYGTLETTTTREERAVETLRRIESAYGTDEVAA